MPWSVVVVSLVLLWSSEASALDLSCKDESNKDADWFILYKAPASVAYTYIDDAGKKAKPDISDGALFYTLAPMLRSVRNMPSSFGFLSYSDQPPGASAKTDMFGHSKGVIMADSGSQTAVWITHSAPQFPFRRDQNTFWSDTGDANGQTFMCVSLPFSALKAVGNHLQNIRAYPFDYDLPIDFPKELIDATKWVHSEALLGKFQTVKTKANKELKLMAKPLGDEAEHGDLYVKLAAGFDSDMYAQTWGSQPGRDESFCDIGERHVMNVDEISTSIRVKWSTKQDHSKWAVSTKQNTDWTCFGDMNRATTQYVRWGGAVCINDKQVNGLFKMFVKKKEDCDNHPAPRSSSNIEALVDDLQEKLELQD